MARTKKKTVRVKTVRKTAAKKTTTRSRRTHTRAEKTKIKNLLAELNKNIKTVKLFNFKNIVILLELEKLQAHLSYPDFADKTIQQFFAARVDDFNTMEYYKAKQCYKFDREALRKYGMSIVNRVRQLTDAQVKKLWDKIRTHESKTGRIPHLTTVNKWAYEITGEKPSPRNTEGTVISLNTEDLVEKNKKLEEENKDLAHQLYLANREIKMLKKELSSRKLRQA